MKYKTKKIVVLLLLVFTVFFKSNVGAVELNSESRVSDYVTDISDYNITQSAEWVDIDKVKYTLKVDTTALLESNNDSITIIVFNISNYMSEEDILKYKAALMKLINTLSNAQIKYAIMDEQTYLNFLSSGEHYGNYLKHGISATQNFMSNIITAPVQSSQLVFDIDMQDVKNIFSSNYGKTNYDVIHINTFPSINNVVGFGNKVEHSLPTDQERLDNGEIVYDYSGLSRNDPLCIEERKYSFEYVSDASAYNDLKHIDFNSLADVVSGASVASCSLLNNYLSFFYNENFFEVLSDDDIKVSGGLASRISETEQNNNQVHYIKWKLGSIKTGQDFTMTVMLHLKSTNINNDNFCTTNNGCSLTSDGVKIIDTGSLNRSIIEYHQYYGEKEGYKFITDSPKIRDKYLVKYKYDNGVCSVASENRVASQLYRPFEAVTINQDDLTCNNYSFLGWMYPKESFDKLYYITNDGQNTFSDLQAPYKDVNVYFYDIKKINDETFYMPSHDVYLFPVWQSLSISKEFTSTNNATPQGASESIYNYYQVGRDVLFGGYCWKMVDTTSNSGTVLLYNGEPDASFRCGDNRLSHNGSSGKTSINLDDEYYYASGYDYDSSLKKYTLKGDLVKSNWNQATSSDLIGKYTCKSNLAIKTCDEMYYISGYNSESSAYVIKYGTDTRYNEIGVSEFNSSDDSIAYTKYVYGDQYKSQYINTLTTRNILLKNEYSGDYYYGNSISFADDKYIISDLNLISSLEDKNNLIGKYTYFSSDNSFSDDEVYYIAGVDDDYIYYLQLYDGEEKEDIEKSYYFSKTYSTVNNVYNLNNPIEIKNTEWFTNALSIDNPFVDKYYVCENSATCNSYLSVAFTNNNQLGYFEDILYSDSVVYDDQAGTYTLVSPQKYQFQYMDFQGSSNGIVESNKYTCAGNTNSCQNVYYVKNLYADHGEAITLTDGVNYATAEENMNTPKYDSDIKKVIDAWYKNNLIDYSDYLMDAWPELHNINSLDNYPITILGYMNQDHLYSETDQQGHEFWVGNEAFLTQKSFLKAFAVYMDIQGTMIQNNFADSVTSIKGVRPIIVLSSSVSVEKQEVDDTSIPLKVIDGNTY